VTRSEIVALARSWIGTPFLHQANVKGVGCDCAGLLRGVVIEAGVLPANLSKWPGAARFLGYARQPDGHSFIEGCRTYMTEIDPQDAIEGDAVAMKFRRDPQHIGILVPYAHGGLAIVHALSMGVVEHRLDGRWRDRITHAYALPGVA